MAITKKSWSSTDDEFVRPISSDKNSSSTTTTTCFQSNYRRSSRSSRFRNESIRLRRGEDEISISLNKSKKHGDIENRCESEKINSGKNDQYMLMCSDSNYESPPFSLINNLTSFDSLYDNSDIESIWRNSRSFFLCQESHFFDGSTINPIEEACLVLHEASENLVWQEDSKEEVVIWLLNSPKTKNDVLQEESSIMSSTESSVFDNSTMSICSNDDFTSPVSDFDRMGSWFSSRLNENLWDFEVGSSDISVYSFNEEKNDLLSCDLTSENVWETADFEDVVTDEPLFWPLERKFDWNSNVKWDLICISPRKNGSEVATSDGLCAPDSVRLSFHKRKKDLKDGFKKRLLYRSRSVVSIELEGKTKAENGKLIRINTMPNSRLSKSKSSTQGFAKNKPLEIKDNNAFLGDFPALLEESYFVSNDEISIEKLVGLNEFDGREGVGEEFDEDSHLILDQSFSDSSRISRISEKNRCGL